MTPTQFLEVIVSVSLQATLVVAATHWTGRLTENERTRCRLWTLSYMLLMVLVVNAAVMPHVRLLPPMRPLTRPLAAEIVAIELQLGRILFWAWLVGGVASLGLLIYRSIQAEKFLRTCRAVDPDVISLATVLGDSSNEGTLQIDRRTVRLVSTTAVTSPFCWQFHQPYIVIPDRLLTFDQEDLKFILRHELSHLRTGHPLQVFLQREIEIVFWFHPMVWWASREWSLAREFQCDDEAVESRSDIVRYLKMLLTIVEQTPRDHQSAATLAFIRNRCELAERARRLVRIAQHDDRREIEHLPQRRMAILTASLITTAIVSISFVWLPVNVLASPAARWSPWPAWTAHVLHDFGVQTRDFELYDHRYALHELFDDGTVHTTSHPSLTSSPATRSE